VDAEPATGRLEPERSLTMYGVMTPQSGRWLGRIFGVTKTHKRGISSGSALAQNHPGGRRLNALERPRERRVAWRLTPGQQMTWIVALFAFLLGGAVFLLFFARPHK
jgi:hypothetical protein